MPCPEVKAAANIGHIVVISDAGCRVKDDFVQDRNDPVRWPFAQVARLAAARHPGLVVHVGDYHPPEDTLSGVAATAGFTCSVHSHCGSVVDTTPPYALDLPPLHLLIFDGADADDANKPGQVAVYRAQLQALLATVPPRAWLLTHRPVWALAQDPGPKPGSTLNATEQAALRGLVPANLDMVMSVTCTISPARTVAQGGRLSWWWEEGVMQMRHYRSRSGRAFPSTG